MQAQTVWPPALTQLLEQQSPLPAQAAPLLPQQRPPRHEPAQQPAPEALQGWPGLTHAEPVVEPAPLELLVLEAAVEVVEPALLVLVAVLLPLLLVALLAGPAVVAAVSALPVVLLPTLGQMQLPLKPSQERPLALQSASWQRPFTLQRLGKGSQKPLWQSASAWQLAQSAAPPTPAVVLPLTTPPLLPQPPPTAAARTSRIVLVMPSPAPGCGR